MIWGVSSGLQLYVVGGWVTWECLVWCHRVMVNAFSFRSFPHRNGLNTLVSVQPSLGDYHVIPLYIDYVTVT